MGEGEEEGCGADCRDASMQCRMLLMAAAKVATDTNILDLRTRYRYMRAVSSVSFRYLDTDRYH